MICHGKRFAVYPAGCLSIIGLPLSMLHQASSPIDYECRKCGIIFGKRDGVAKFALIFLLLMLVLLFLAAFVP